MLKSGLGENTEFSKCHPIVGVLYFVITIGVTMFSMSPYFLGVTFTFSWCYSFLLKGTEGLKRNIMFSLSVLIIMAVINTLFTHNGATVLFYFNTNAITLEALIYGICAAVMLSSVIIWFSAFNVIMTSEKIIYLFGKTAPVLGLTLSMVFRFIPLLKDRYEEITMGQKCIRQDEPHKFIEKAKLITKKISILIAWSLESAIESADSMEARGYGLRGRTSFHLYKFNSRDYLLMAVMFILGAVVIVGAIYGKTSMYFYPKVEVPSLDLMAAITLVSYATLLSLPIYIDIKGELKWKQLDLKS